MANIANMAVKIGFDGGQALAGSAQISDALLKVADSGNKAAKAMNALDLKKLHAAEATRAARMLMTAGEIEKDIARERLEERLKGLNALERQEVLAAEKLKARLMKMSAADIERELSATRRAERLKGLNALEREELIASEKLKARLASMTAREIEQDIAHRRLQERLKGLNALEREELLAAERMKAKLMGMSARDIEREMASTRMRERMKGLNALEREELLTAERTKARRMRMSSDEIRAEIAAEQMKSQAARRFEGLNALEKQRLMQEDAKRARRMGMTATQIEREIQGEQMRERLKGLNALERREVIEAERKKMRRMRMTAEQIQAEIAAEEKARQAAPKTSLFERIGIKGLADAKAGLEMIRGIMQTFVMVPAHAAFSVMQLGSQLENMQTIARGLETRVGGGADSIERLRRISTGTGAPLETLNKAMLNLSASGMSIEDATRSIEKTSNAITLLGGTAEAADMVTGAIGSLRESAIANEGPLRQLQASGLNVFGALQKEISRATGQAVSLDEAMAMLRDGSVLSSTAIRAIFTASEDAAGAAEQVGNSFTGQFQRLTAGFTEMLRDIGQQLLRLFEPEKAFAALRGVFDGIMESVREIASAFAPVLDPADKGKQLKDLFDSGREVGKTLGKALMEAAATFKELMTALLPDLKSILTEMRNLTPGRAGLAVARAGIGIPFEAGRDIGRQIMRDIDKGFGLGIAPGGNLDQIIRETEILREKLGGGKFAGGAAAMGDFGDAMEEVVDDTEAFVAELIKQTEDMKLANASVERLRQDALKSSMTDAEKFGELITAVDTKLKQASAASEGQQALLREALGRQVGAQIQSAIQKFRQQQQDLPSALVAGSAAEVEARIRAERGMRTNEEEVLAALEEQTRQGQEQTAALNQLVAIAAANGKAPATLVLPK